jgi:hypothetical protein
MAARLTPEERMRRRGRCGCTSSWRCCLAGADRRERDLHRAYPWWLWVLIAWMPLIAGHTAWSMGLFDRNKEGS